MLRRLITLGAVALLALPAAADARPTVDLLLEDPSPAGPPGGLGTSDRERWSLVRDRWYEMTVDYEVTGSGRARNAVVRGRGSRVELKARRIGERGRLRGGDEGLVRVPVRLTGDSATLQVVVTSAQGRLARHKIRLTAVPEPPLPQDGLWRGTVQASPAELQKPVSFRVRGGRLEDVAAPVTRYCPGEPGQAEVTAGFPSVRIPRIGVLRRTVERDDDDYAIIDLRFPSATTAKGYLAYGFRRGCGGSTTFTAQRTGP